jgi:hypothetical protein
MDSHFASEPVWGMGSSTRLHRENVHISKGRLFSNNLPSVFLLGGSIPPLPPGMQPSEAEAPAAPAETLQLPSRARTRRALAVALSTDGAKEADPALAAALTTLRNRVATLDASRGAGAAPAATKKL